MNLFNDEAAKLIKYRQDKSKWLIVIVLNLIFIHYFLRFQLLMFNKFTKYLNHYQDQFFDHFFNFNKQKQLLFFISAVPLYFMYALYLIVFKSDIIFWDPLIITLITKNWKQFVADNLNFAPTFSLRRFIRKPIVTFSEWNEIFGKLKNFKLVRFKKKLKIFLYLSQKERAKYLLRLLIYFFIFSTMFNASSKFQFSSLPAEH